MLELELRFPALAFGHIRGVDTGNGQGQKVRFTVNARHGGVGL